MRPSLYFVLALTISSAIFAETVPVYSPHARTNPEFKKKLKSAIIKVGHGPIFFSKFDEFSSYLDQKRPNYRVEMINPSFKGKPRFLGKKTVRVSAFSLKSFKHNSLDKLKVGMVSMARRKDLLDEIKKKTNQRPALFRTVSKEEDLVPLLFFKNVDIVFVDERSIRFLNKRFNIQLKKQKWTIEWMGEAVVKSEYN